VRATEGEPPERVGVEIKGALMHPFAPLSEPPARWKTEQTVGPEFRLDGLARVAFTVRIRADGFLSKTLESADLLPAPGESARHVQIVLERKPPSPEPAPESVPRPGQRSGTWLTGRLLTPEGHAPPGAAGGTFVVAFPEDADEKQVYAHPRDGRYEARLSPGVWWLRAIDFRLTSPAAVRVVVAEGENEAPDIRYLGEKEGILEGIVRGAGRPLEGAVVLAWPFPYRPFERVEALRLYTGNLSSASTGKDGRFTLTQVGAGRITVLTVHRDHLPTSVEVKLPTSSDRPKVDIAMRSGAWVEAEIDAHLGTVSGVFTLDPQGPHPESPYGYLTRRLVAHVLEGDMRDWLSGRQSFSIKAGGRLRSGPLPPGNFYAKLNIKCEDPVTGAKFEVWKREGFEVRGTENVRVSFRCTAEDIERARPRSK
ncbi:MAG: carboxypeptidase-like regulatory domain-containing protein, partial [Planctomycetota bacterium]